MSQITAMTSGILASYEEKIRSGKAAEVIASVREKIAHKRPARDLVLPLAQLVRRAGAPGLSIQLLRPIVRPTGRRAEKASASEVCAYAAALVALGIQGEALRLLEGVSVKETPEPTLFKAYARIGQWDYASAIPLLEEYLRDSRPTDYQRLVAKVNLAASLVAEGESVAAESLLGEIYEKASSQNLALLKGNALELRAQNAIFASDWKAADGFLDEAFALLADKPYASSLYVRKWKAVSALLQSRASDANAAGVARVRQEAMDQGAWETVRDCDFFLGLATRDQNLIQKVYFGTPFASYRARVRKLAKLKDLPTHFDWGRGRKRIDLADRAGLLAVGLKPERLVTKLLLVLCTDLYKPFEVSGLHGWLFPEEFYDPQTSSMRIHQLMARLRAWVRERNLPIALSEKDGRYRIEPTGLILELPVDLASDLRISSREKLAREFGSNSFTLSEAALRLRVPERTLSRQLGEWIESGAVLKYNRARATRYGFKENLT